MLPCGINQITILFIFEMLATRNGYEQNVSSDCRQKGCTETSLLMKDIYPPVTYKESTIILTGSSAILVPVQGIFLIVGFRSGSFKGEVLLRERGRNHVYYCNTLILYYDNISEILCEMYIFLFFVTFWPGHLLGRVLG